MAAAVEREKPASIAEVAARAKSGKLAGRRCTRCGKAFFTDQLRCDACAGQSFEGFESKGEGEVVSFTIIGVPSEPYAAFVPYAFVVVRMREGAGCTGWMPSVKSPHELKIGDRVRVIPPPNGLGVAFEKAA